MQIQQPDASGVYTVASSGEVPKANSVSDQQAVNESIDQDWTRRITRCVVVAVDSSRLLVFVEGIAQYGCTFPMSE